MTIPPKLPFGFLRRQNSKSDYNDTTTAMWEEVPLGDLRKKVTQSFRNRRRRRNNNTLKQQNTTTTTANNNNSDSNDDVMTKALEEQQHPDVRAPSCPHRLLRLEDERMPNTVDDDDDNDEVSSNKQPPLLLDDYSISSSSSIIIQPNQNDVIFTGKKNSKHAGNQRFHSLVQEFSQIYDSSGTDDKSKREVVNTIIDMIHEAGGRFLKQQQQQQQQDHHHHLHGGTTTTDDDSNDATIISSCSYYWKEVPVSELRTKTMQAFRNRRRHHDVSKKNNATTTTTSLARD